MIGRVFVCLFIKAYDELLYWKKELFYSSFSSQQCNIQIGLNFERSIIKFFIYRKFSIACFVSFTETPLWLVLQVAPIRNERDLVVLLLLTFRDITAFKQIVDAEDTKSGNLFI